MHLLSVLEGQPALPCAALSFYINPLDRACEGLGAWGSQVHACM